MFFFKLAFIFFFFFVAHLKVLYAVLMCLYISLSACLFIGLAAHLKNN